MEQEKKQMPGLYQSKDISKLGRANLPGIKAADESMVNEDEQKRVTNDADPDAGAHALDEIETPYPDKKIPDKNYPDTGDVPTKQIEDETHAAAMEEVKENYQDETVNVEPVIDVDGNELGGQG